jgi:hypothetical protein
MKTKTMNIEQILRNGNSTKNQSIKQKFVGREVYCNVGFLVEYCLSKGYEDSESPISLDNLENYYSYPEYNSDYARFDGGTEEQRDNEIERLRDLQSDLYDEMNGENDEEIEAKRDKIEEEIGELNNLETEPQEVFEWWAISSYLYDKLKALGYVVCDAGSCYIWGRTTTGQAILLDYVITKICAEMGILEGQENEWTV